MHLLWDADASGGPSSQPGELWVGNGTTRQTYGTLAGKQAPSLVRS